MAIDSTIRAIIRENGHITLDEMMQEVASNNPCSYYRNIMDIGEKGDFITSPEISQLFGEIIGIWVIQQWNMLGKPRKFTLLELGPGTGILMRDILRSTLLAQKMMNSADILMYDINPHFIRKQQELLGQNKNIGWINSLDNIPKQPLVVLSNEFFDALPIKQYRKIKTTWYESILVTDPTDGMIKYDRMELNSNLQEQLNKEHQEAGDGAVIEESVPSQAVVKKLAKIINKYTGSFLAIDYGYDIAPSLRLKTQYNPTLQAIKNHEYQSMLDTLGEADLSAHVDFQAIMRAASMAGIKNGIIDTQESFLKSYGIMVRLRQLQEQNSKELGEILSKQVYRLTAREQMGELFKVIQFWKCP